MQDAEILQLWKSYEHKIEQSLSLNHKLVQDMSRLKVKSLLGSMRPIKVFTLAIGTIWVALMWTIVLKAIYVASPFFLIFAISQIAITQLALGIYVYQLILIQQTDISEPVLETQKHLAQLKSSTLWVTRILFLQLPFWTCFFWNASMFQNGITPMMIVNIPITFLFTGVAIWLFVNIRFQNRNKTWFRWIFNGSEWTPILKSMDILEQVEEFSDQN